MNIQKQLNLILDFVRDNPHCTEIDMPLSTVTLNRRLQMLEDQGRIVFDNGQWVVFPEDEPAPPAVNPLLVVLEGYDYPLPAREIALKAALPVSHVRDLLNHLQIVKTENPRDRRVPLYHWRKPWTL